MINNVKKIGIDARFFGAKDKGLGRYVEELIRALGKSSFLDGRNQYFIFLNKKRFNDYNPQNISFKKDLFKNFKKYNLDLMHFTYFKVPFLYKKKFIVTIHDLILSHVGFFKKIAYRLILRLTLKRAEKIIAVSNYTKNNLIDNFKVGPEKIRVIYNGLKINKKEKTYNKNKRPYVLCIGNDYPHKNFKNLKLAFSKIGLNYDLILITEFIGERKLNELYKNAELYVQPSLVEGFGFPPLEAMSWGVPVLTSNIPCFLEILGNAVIYFNPLDIEDMVDKIKKTLLDNKIKKELIKKGFEQIKKYNWDDTTKSVLDIYNLF